MRPVLLSLRLLFSPEVHPFRDGPQNPHCAHRSSPAFQEKDAGRGRPALGFLFMEGEREMPARSFSGLFLFFGKHTWIRAVSNGRGTCTPPCASASATISVKIVGLRTTSASIYVCGFRFTAFPRAERYSPRATRSFLPQYCTNEAYRGTSLTKKRTLLGNYRRFTPGILGES